ncbi:MAG: oligosaccharide flippase family protein [Tranquillimonas sp.]
MRRYLTAPFLVSVAARVGGQAVAFLIVVIAVRYLTLADFGSYALAWAVTVVFNTFVFTGFYHAILRSPDFEGDADTLFWLIAAVGAAGAVVVGLTGLAAGGTQTPVGATMLALAPIPALIAPISWNEARLVRAGRVRAASGYVLAAEGVALAAVTAGFAGGWGLGALILGRYASTLAGLAATFWLTPRRPRLRFRPAAARAAAGTALPLWGTSAIGMFSNYGADLILGAFLTPAAVGAYRGGARIAQTASDVVLQPLAVLSWSRFARLEGQGDTARLRLAWQQNAALSAAMVWPVMASVAVLAPQLVVTLFDASWLPAAGVVTLLSLARAARSLGALLEPTMLCTGRARMQFRLRLIDGALLLVALLALGPFGGEAAALAHLLVGAGMGLAALIVMARALDLGRADLARVFLPGAGLTLLCLAVIAGTGAARAALGPVAGLAATGAAVAGIWLATMGVYLVRRVLVLPTP